MGRHPTLGCLRRNEKNTVSSARHRPRPRPWLPAALVLLSVAGGCSRKPGKAGASPSPEASPARSSPSPEIDRVTPLPDPIPDVVATVNGEPVLFVRIASLARKFLEKSEDRAKDRPFAVRKAAQELIDRELLFQEARARKLEPEARRVEQAYNEARLRHRDDADWAAWLKGEGYDANSFRTELRVQETIRVLVEQETRKVPEISDDEAEAFYKEHPGAFGAGDRLRVAHILCRLSDDSPEKVKTAARVKAASLLFRAKRGEDFAMLARQFSDDLMSKSEGGLLPEFVHGQTPPPFEEAAFALEKPGDLSEVVVVPDGLHIIKLIERKPAADLNFDDIKGTLKERMLVEKRQDVMRALLERLRSQAKIETFI
jgi:peptidyl-prolyl cis-trans isomerase C